VNIGRIVQDLEVGLYEQVHLNFTSSLPRNLLEDLALQVAQLGASQQVARVYDQYLNFCCLERNLFTLSQPDTFRALNAPQASESEVDAILDSVAAGIFSASLAMGGACPLLCAAKGGPAEGLAGRLEKRLRSHMTNMQSAGQLGEAMLGDGVGMQQRPLLVLLDRAADLCSLLKHESTYNALVHDVLGMRLNRVGLPPAASNSDGQRRPFDVDSGDAFWAENAGLPFPTVAENVDAALSKYRTDMQQVTRTNSGVSLDELRSASDLSGAMLTPEQLKLAISVLPELTERKRLIDSHLSMATALLEEIKARDLGALYLLEHQQHMPDKASLLAILRNPAQGSASDKMRLFLAFYLSPSATTNMDAIPPSDMLEYERVLREAGCEMGALEAAKRWRSHHRMILQMTSTSPIAPITSPRTQTGDLLASLGSRITSTTSGVFGNLMSGVKNLLPDAGGQLDTPLTKQLDMALERASGMPPTSQSMFRPSTSSGSASTPEDLFTLLDPRQRSHQQSLPSNSAQYRQHFTHAVIFILGGSNYAEYNQAQEWARRRGTQMQIPLHVTFGTTEMLTGAEFLAQLAQL